MNDSSDTKGNHNILRAIISKVRINNNLLERIFFSSRNRIFFNHGWYDIKRKFIDIFDNVETLIKTNRDFKESSLDDQNKVNFFFWTYI